MAFALTGPTAIDIKQGESAFTSYKALATNKPYRNVSFSVSGLPLGCTAVFSPSSGKPTFTTTLKITAAANSPVGVFTIQVRAKDAKSTKTIEVTLTIYLNRPVTTPVLSSLTPNNVDEDTGASAVQINGTGFVDGATAFWNGNARVTTFVSSIRVDMNTLAADLTDAGTASITASNPGGAVSNSLTFTINSASFTADVWVAKAGDGGSDSNDGLSEGAPKLTIAAGVVVLNSFGNNAGKKMAIKQGDYNERIWTSEMTLPSGSSFANAAQIVGYPGHTVRLPSIANISTANSYFIFENLITNPNVFGSGNTPMYANVGDHWRFRNCRTTLSANHGCLLTEMCLGSFEFINVEFDNNGTDGLAHSSYGIYISCPSVVLDHCNIHENGGYGIHWYATAADGPGGVATTSNGIAEYCNIWGNGTLTAESHFGILMSSGDNLLVYNTIIRGNSAGISMVPGNGTGGCSNPKVYNTTIYDNSSQGFEGLAVGSGVSSATVKNNIVLGNPATITDAGSGSTFDNNLCDSTSTPCEFSSNASTEFVNAATNNFHLNSGAVSRDKATDLSGVFTDDYDSVTRSAWDIGAFEFV